MAVKTMKDFLQSDTADYETTPLEVCPQEVIIEEGEKNIENLEADDGDESSIVHSSQSVFFVTLKWPRITSADAGTILDFYHTTSKANGTARKFLWTHYDGNTYVVKFRGPISREFGTFSHGVSVKLKVFGNYAYEQYLTAESGAYKVVGGEDYEVLSE